ncbi:MAG: glucose 1-dehydrogenase [Spirochaetota bacterium]
MYDFTNKTVLITGANSGLGKAVATKLAGTGCKLVLTARNKEKGEAVVAELQQNSPNLDVAFYSCDISKSEDIRQLFAQIREKYQSLHCAVNNAGYIGPSKLSIKYPEDEWDKIIATNIKGTFLCLQEEIRMFLETGTGGSAVNVSSVYGLVGSPFGGSPYSASKHALLGLTKSVALEFAKKNIRVNAVCPGGIDTEMLTGIFEKLPNPDKAQKGFALEHPMRRFSSPAEVANGVVWLLSEEASFVTGTSLAIDGGYTAQ